MRYSARSTATPVLKASFVVSSIVSPPCLYPSRSLGPAALLGYSRRLRQQASLINTWNLLFQFPLDITGASCLQRPDCDKVGATLKALENRIDLEGRLPALLPSLLSQPTSHLEDSLNQIIALLRIGRYRLIIERLKSAALRPNPKMRDGSFDSQREHKQERRSFPRKISRNESFRGATLGKVKKLQLLFCYFNGRGRYIER